MKQVFIKCEEPSFLCNHLRVKRAQNINSQNSEGLLP